MPFGIAPSGVRMEKHEMQAGYFYKAISSPIVQDISPIIASDPDAGGVSIQTVNASGAHVKGLEVGYQQHLSYLPGPMHFLGISADYSYTESQITGLSGRTDHLALLRQAPNTWNFSPTFDTRKFSMRVGMTYNGAMIYAYQWTDITPPGPDSLGVKGPAGDNCLYPRYQIDVQVSHKVRHSLQAYAYGPDLNNEQRQPAVCSAARILQANLRGRSAL